jgi:hypothetical protein
MPFVKIDYQPTDRKLRQFALTTLVAAPMVVGLISRWNTTALAVAGFVSLAVAIASFVRPQWLRSVFVAAQLLTAPIGIVVGEAALLLVYLTLFAPLGVVFRFIGRDPLARRFSAEAKSYWQTKAPPKDAESYFRQS